MKKPFFLSLLTLCPLAMGAPQAFFNGFIVSGAFGGTTAQFDYTQSINFNEIITDVTIKNQSNLFANTPAGLVSLAYSYQSVNNFVVAGAFTAGYGYAKLNDQLVEIFSPNTFLEQDDIVKIDAHLTNDFSLVVKPGYVFDKTTLLYGLIGPRWGNFKTKIKTTSDLFLSPNINASSQSGYECGLTLGLGIQQLVNPRYSWGLEYAYTTYGQISAPKFSGIVPAFTGDIIYTNNSTLDASSNTLMFLIAYRI
jgi:opacity protein-like surface antigen